MILFEIIKIKKNSYNNICIIDLNDDTNIKLHIDLIIKYGLTKGKIFDQDMKSKFESEQESIDAISYGIRIVSLRPRSIKEFKQKLRLKKFSDSGINNAVKKLLELNLLNDFDFANKFIEHLVKIKRFGKLRIMNELRKKGIQESIIRVLTDEIEISDEQFELIVKSTLRKLRMVSNKSLEKQKNSILIYLKNKGYSLETALKVLEMVFRDI